MTVADLVAARGHGHHALRRYCRTGLQVSPQIRDHTHFQAEHGTVPLESQLGRHGLVTPLRRCDEILDARGDPLDRPPEFQRQVAGQRIFLVEGSLAAKATADIGRDDPHPVLRKAERGRQIRAHAVRTLGGKPYG